MAPPQARAYWLSAPGEGSIVEQPLQEPAANEVLVRTRFTAISRGTESLVFAGRVPASERARMRAPFQEGDFPAPVKYGYCNVGEIEAGARDLVGRTVFSLFPHQTRFVVPATAVHVVPASVPAGRAVLAANMETALNGVWDSEIKPGDRVAVVGAGAVGCLVAWLVGQMPGCEVHLVDVNPARERLASVLGVRFVVPASAPVDCDIVFHASGASDGLTTALSAAGFESTIVELSWFGSQQVHVPLGGVFHSRRLTIKSSQVGHVASTNRARWDRRRRMALALALLASPALDALITGESPFDELPRVMREVATGAQDVVCHRIRY